MKILLVVIAFLLMTFVSNAQEKQFQKACEGNSVRAFDKFISKYPSSEFTEEAAFKKAVLINTSNAFESFIDKYPSGTFIDKAKSALCSIEYKKIEISYNINLVKNYLQRFSYCKDYSLLARKKLTVLEIEKNNSISFLKNYLENSSDCLACIDLIKKRLVNLEFKRADSIGTIEAYLYFLKWYPEDKQSKQAEEKIQESIPVLKKLNGIRAAGRWQELSGNSSPWKKWYDEHAIIYFHDEVVDRNLKIYQDYLDKYPNGFDKNNSDKAIEKNDFEKIKDSLSIEKLNLFLVKYPQSYYFTEIKDWEEDLKDWEKAKKEDWYSYYESYIRDFPNGFYVDKAKERLNWLKSHKAIVNISFPSTVNGTSSPYSNVESPYFPWTTTFSEEGGGIKYKVRGWKIIYDKTGEAWGFSYGSIDCGEQLVLSGQKVKFDTWSDGSFSGGYAIITWKGEDAGGHPIELIEKVYFR